MKTNNEVVITETSRMQQMWGWWRAKLELAAQSPWYASHLLRRFYDLMKALRPSKQLVASTVTGAALLVGSIALNPAPAQAAGITVNSTADAATTAALNGNGTCDLREALEAANTNLAVNECPAGGVGLDTITLTANGTITLLANLPNISNAGEDIELNGPGASNLTIDGGGTFQTIYSDGTGNNVTIDGLTITRSADSGIFADGSITVTNSVISGSGGIGVFAVGNASLTNSTISGNANNGVRANNNATVTNSTISGNATNGVRVNSNATVTNSTISGNASNGVYAKNNATVTNSTISGNTFSGVYAYNNDITVINSTITGNGDQGVFAENDNGGAAVITLKNSLIVGNTGNDVDCSVSGVTLTSNGKNLIKTQNGAACPMPTEVTALAVASIMGPLQNNGGSTQTHALVTGSPALDKGLNADSPWATDQRGTGFARISNTTIDIGAFELQVATVAKAVGGVAEFITPVAHDGLMWRVAGMMGAGLAMGLGVLGLSRAKKTE